MHTVVETPAYIRAAKDAGMTRSEMEHAITTIAAHPTAGAILVGTGGCRKVRIPKERGGKSGGYRLVTYYCGDELPVFLITVFDKSETSNLSKAERNVLAQMTRTLRASYDGRDYW